MSGIKLFKALLFPYIVINFIKSQIEYQTINLTKTEIKINNLKKEKYFYYFTPESKNLSNYYQIVVKDENSIATFDYYKHLISYYKDDPTFTNRSQTSNLGYPAIMWLNKAQIKNGFYLSVEFCKEKNILYNYYINIIPKNNGELILGDQYSYYITEDNQIMTFNIIGNLSKYQQTNTSNFVTIWVKGNRNISTKLEGKYIEKHSKHDAYIIKLDELKEFNYSLNIEATIGDYIYVGSSFLQGNENILGELYPKIYVDGLFGFLKKGLIEENCYQVNSIQQNYILKGLDDNNIEIPYENIMKSYHFYICIKIPKQINELFYYFQNFDVNINSYNYINYMHNRLITGFNYHNMLHGELIVGYIPVQVEENYNFLAFSIFSSEEKSKAYIINCDNYPLCPMKEEIQKGNYIQIQRQLSNFYYSFSKEEIDSNISPINKVKKVLVFTCNETGYNDYCDIYVNIYTDKTIIMPLKNPIQYKFISRGNEDNLLIKSYVFYQYRFPIIPFIAIEKISGNFNIIYDHAYYKNYYSFKKFSLLYFKFNKRYNFFED